MEFIKLSKEAASQLPKGKGDQDKKRMLNLENSNFHMHNNNFHRWKKNNNFYFTYKFFFTDSTN